MEEIFLGILIDPQRDNVQRPRVRDFLDAGDGFFHAGQTEVVAQQRVGRFPADARYCGGRVV